MGIAGLPALSIGRKPLRDEPTLDCLDCGYIAPIGAAYNIVLLLAWLGVAIPCPDCSSPLKPHGLFNDFAEFLIGLN